MSASRWVRDHPNGICAGLTGAFMLGGLCTMIGMEHGSPLSKALEFGAVGALMACVLFVVVAALHERGAI